MPLHTALRARRPSPTPLYHTTTPNTTLHMFVGVISTCCTRQVAAKRDAIRTTWLASQTPSIHARFVLGHPVDAAARRAALPLLQHELGGRAPRIVMVPTADAYHNLPSKVLHMLVYALSGPVTFSHVLKVDDDCFVRPPALLHAMRRSTVVAAATQALDDAQQQLKGVVALRVAGEVGGWAGGVGGVQSKPCSSAVGGMQAAVAAEAQRLQYEVATLQDTLTRLTAQQGEDEQPIMQRLYMGSVGAPDGFVPVRNPASKWFLDPARLPDEEAPIGLRYASGWAYVLSTYVRLYAHGTLLHVCMSGTWRCMWRGRRKPTDGQPCSLATAML